MCSPAAARILIVDDHPVVRRGLLVALEGPADLVVVGEAASLEQAVELCRTCDPEVILLDLTLPGAAPEHAVAKLREGRPAARILILATDEARNDLCRALKAGAHGCVSRMAQPEELLQAIRTVHAGMFWLTSEIVQRCRAYECSVSLSDDEMACLRFLAVGAKRAQMASELGWSETRLRRVLRGSQRKLGAKNETHMLFMALQRGIVSLE
jgi:DNA-binding NarL/FixJ family response regulator